MAGKITRHLLKKSIYLLLIGLACCPVLKGQEKLNFEFAFLTEENGLSNNRILCMIKDKDGFLWIGTADGLNRYDGSHFIAFKTNHKDATTLANNAVHALCEDKEGNIWAGTDDGISYYDKKTNKFQSFKELDGQKFARCYHIICDKKGDIWFADGMGLYHLSKKTKVITSMVKNPASANAISNDDILAIKEYPQGNAVWIATAKGVNYVDIDTKKFYNFIDNPLKLPFFNDHEINKLTIDNNNLIFFDFTESKIVVVNLLTKKVITEYSWLAKKNIVVSHISVDKDHNYWISLQDNSLFFVDNKTHEIKEVDYNPARKREFSGIAFNDLCQNAD